MIHLLTSRRLLLLLLETILIVSAVTLAAWLRLHDEAWTVMLYDNGIWKTLLVAGVAQACLYYADLYNLRLVSDRRELFIRIVQALGAASFILAAIYFWVPDLVIGRGVFMITAFLMITIIIGWRMAFEWMSRICGMSRPKSSFASDSNQSIIFEL